MENAPFAFIDDCGGPGKKFDKENVSSHFIVTAIVVKAEEFSQVDQQTERIRRKHFQSGEMKSSKVGKNHARRIRILQDISQLDIKIVSVVSDKRKFTSPGFDYEYPFRVFLNNQLLQILYGSFPGIRISCDKCGDEEVQRKWLRYIQRNYPRDLFKDSEFEFVDSEASTLVQVADMIGGTIARGFDEQLKTPEYKEFQSILGDQILRIEEWPQARRRAAAQCELAHTDIHPAMAKMACERAQRLMTRLSESSDVAENAQAECLECLYLWFQLDPFRYVTTNELLQSVVSMDLSPNQFRMKVIGPLRDANALIVSCEKGYKLPCSAEEAKRYLYHWQKTLSPMVNRLRRFCADLRTITLDDLDLLSMPEFEEIRQILSRVSPAVGRGDLRQPVSVTGHAVDSRP